jgi:SpoVK/Ycf46/Vps4 family AAA+-type ATPase
MKILTQVRGAAFLKLRKDLVAAKKWPSVGVDHPYHVYKAISYDGTTARPHRKLQLKGHKVVNEHEFRKAVMGGGVDVTVKGNRIDITAKWTPPDDWMERAVHDSLRSSMQYFTTMATGHAPAPEEPTVSYDDIIGLEDAKRALQDAIETPRKHPELYKAYGIAPTKGILLYGPPGCGKTMLAKAAKGSLGPDGHMFYVKGPELLDKYVGGTEEKIRRLFHRARSHNGPAIIFIDEAESLFRNRGSASQSWEVSQVTQFLAEMDGLDPTGALVLLATNREEDIDPAVLRDGRVDRKIRIPRPERATTRAILSAVVDSPDVDLGAVVEYIYQENLVVHQVGPLALRLQDVLNGAMVTGLAQKAALVALHEDVEAKRTEATGVQTRHLMQAVDTALQEARAVRHEDALREQIPRLRTILEAGEAPDTLN